MRLWPFGRKKTSQPAARQAASPAPARATPVVRRAPEPRPAHEAETGPVRTAEEILHDLEARAEAKAPVPEGPVDATLGRQLVAEGPCTREFIRQQVTVSGKADSYLCRVLLEHVHAPTDDQLFRLLAADYHVPQVDLKQCRVLIPVARSVSPDIAVKYRMVPIDRVGDLLCVVFAGEVSPKGTEAIRRATGLRVKALRCPPHHMDILLRRLYHDTPQRIAAAPLSEREYEEAVHGPDARWESVHVSRGPVRADRLA